MSVRLGPPRIWSIALGLLALLSYAAAIPLQDAVDTDAVRADLTGLVHTALAPTHVSVWLQQ